MVTGTVPLAEVGPASGGFTGLAGACWVVGYWQSTEAASGVGRTGSGVSLLSARGVAGALALAGFAAADGVAVASTAWCRLPNVTISTTMPMTSTTAAAPPATAYLRRALARSARRASWRSSLRFAGRGAGQIRLPTR